MSCKAGYQGQPTRLIFFRFFMCFSSVDMLGVCTVLYGLYIRGMRRMKALNKGWGPHTYKDIGEDQIDKKYLKPGCKKPNSKWTTEYEKFVYKHRRSIPTE